MTAARGLTLALAAAVLTTHVGVWLIAPDVRTWARMYYVARSIEEVILFFSVLAFARLAGKVTLALLAVCVFGMVMGTLAGVCGGVFYLGGGVTPSYDVCEQTQQVTPWLLLTGALILGGVARSLDRG